jgi:hypothetical protein
MVLGRMTDARSSRTLRSTLRRAGRHGGTGGTLQARRLNRYQVQLLVQQQLPPPHVVLAPGATCTVNDPVLVLPMWPVNLSIRRPSFLDSRREYRRSYIRA